MAPFCCSEKGLGKSVQRVSVERARWGAVGNSIKNNERVVQRMDTADGEQTQQRKEKEKSRSQRGNSS